MMLIVSRMRERITIAKTDGDSAYCAELLLFGELAAKLTVATLVATIRDDPARHRYQFLHRLVRADGIGEWGTAAGELLTGPASQFLAESARVKEFHDALRARGGPESWQYRAISLLQTCLETAGVEVQKLGNQVAARQWLNDFATLRNKTRGHGAPTSSVWATIAPALQQSIDLWLANIPCFAAEWAHLHRNLSGKYRVSPISSITERFARFTKSSETATPDGVYIDLDMPLHVELLYSTQDLIDFFLPNGGFSKDGRTFETLSYISGSVQHRDASKYHATVSGLPPSITQGRGDLSLVGSTFTNVPPYPPDYIERSAPERDLLAVLLDDRHPIVTLVGPGGTGKTSVALRVLDRVVSTHSRFDVVVWFSARDIDLLPAGPKLVRPQQTTQREIAAEYCRLTGQPTQKAIDTMSSDLTKAAVGSVLFVFDNFETVAQPVDLFNWVDGLIRSPNKALITTRTRDFKGDYPIDIKGMSQEESLRLIDEVSKALGLSLSAAAKDEIYTESDGHPYVMKILIGEMQRKGSTSRPERIVADKGEILTALFERTYSGLTPAARRVFLTLAGWRSLVPSLALRAVVLRPGNERFDVEGAVDELERSSMIQVVRSDKDQELFLQVPLAAAIFGRQKLRVDPAKASVEADLEFIMMFGASLDSDVRHGVMPRVNRMVNEVAKRLDSGRGKLSDFVPVLDFVARVYPPAWLLVAELYAEWSTPSEVRRALSAFLEGADSSTPVADRVDAWERLASLAEQDGDAQAALHASAELASMPSAPIEALSAAANRANAVLHAAAQSVGREERKILIRRLADALSRRSGELDATGLSRLAWLYMQLGDDASARRHTEQGLIKEQWNPHIAKLGKRLGLTP